MRYFPDEACGGIWARIAVVALPLLYLVTALLYSADVAPWDRQVDPESAYAMNGLAWAAGFPMLKNDHPGTTTILLAGMVDKVWAMVSGHPDVVEFGLKNFDATVYAARAVEAAILSGILLIAGVIIRNATRSPLAAMLFQVGPFVHPNSLHFEVMLMPECLMVACALLGMALVVKAALGEEPPSSGLGAAMGLVFALGLSSKYLHLPLAVFGVALLRNRLALMLSLLAGALGFFLFNRLLNPLVFSNGFRWLLRLATHKGVYGEGEQGFIDFNLFWPNMADIVTAGPAIFAIFATGAVAALARMATSRRYLDPVSLTLLASFLAFAAQLVATSKHFNLHYMMASWALTGGVIVLTVIEIRRLLPAVSVRAVGAVAAAGGAAMVATTLIHLKVEAIQTMAVDRAGARLSNAVVTAGPSCANVSGKYMRAPENALSFGGDSTLGFPEVLERFSGAYRRSFKVALLDYDVGRDLLTKDFHPYSFAQLAAEYSCLVLRTALQAGEVHSNGLYGLHPEHCLVAGVNLYTVGIACEKVQRAAEAD